jgi:ribonuclease HI
MSGKPLRILQANLQHRHEAQHALLNDEALQDFGILLIQEPAGFRTDQGRFIATPQSHQCWTQYTPSLQDNSARWPFRSLIYANQSLRARQIEVPSKDVAAIEIQVEGRTCLAFSIYVPPIEGSSDLYTAIINNTLQHVESVCTQYPTHEIILGGDFNRHGQLWGGDGIRRDEGERIVQCMDQLGLRLLLPRGTATHESGTTIDLVFATSGLADDLAACRPWHTAYGSDHEAIETQFALNTYEPSREPRRLFRNTNWPKACHLVSVGLLQLPLSNTVPNTAQEIDRFTSHFTKIVQDAVFRCTPIARPSPYTKRWWNLNLSQLRRKYTQVRYEARSQRRGNLRDRRLEERVRTARKIFHDACRRQRRAKWEEFLDSSQNIWKAAKYLHPAEKSQFGSIPALETPVGISTEDSEISKELVNQFFSQTAQVEEYVPQTRIPVPLRWEDVSKEEIHDAILRAAPYKAPGPDGLPAIVWKMLWSEVGDHITTLFRACIQTGHFPHPWRSARILPLRKPDKSNYKLAKAYRPISLLATLGKALESVLAERISYLDETHGLLPKCHFGARKQRSTIDALQLATEDIYQAWKRKHVVTMLSFDLKGAFNGVNKDVLVQRLRARRIPNQIARLVHSFCSNRKASVMVNGVESETMDIVHAGLPQGSPLSPILFLFYNADLITGKLSSTLGKMAFVDDFTVWVSSPTTRRNINRLRGGIIPMVERWCKTSGATFEPDKTQLIHFSRDGSHHQNEANIRFQGQTITPKEEIKLLGLILDQRLSFHSHSARAAKRGEKAALALRRLRGLRPGTARQLFLATIAPVTDYGAPVWVPCSSIHTQSRIDRAMKIGAVAVTGMFKSAAMAAAMVEAGLELPQDRLHEQIRKNWFRLQHKPRHHVSWYLIYRLNQIEKFQSPLEATAIRHGFIDPTEVDLVPAFSKPPWQSGPKTLIQSKEEAIKAEQARVDDPYAISFYTDGSVRHELAGVGIYTPPPFGLQVSITLDRGPNPDPMQIELEAIQVAVQTMVENPVYGLRSGPVTHHIVTDSERALRILQRPGKRKNETLRRIFSLLQTAERQQLTIQFDWIPAHSGLLGNEIAHSLAHSATEIGRVPVDRKIALREWQKPDKEYQEQKRARFQSLKVARHLRKLDAALPGRHTRKLYDRLKRIDAAILAQIRGGYCRLNSYLHKIGQADSELCECGQKETVEHFLLACPRWT